MVGEVRRGSHAGNLLFRAAVCMHLGLFITYKWVLSCCDTACCAFLWLRIIGWDFSLCSLGQMCCYQISSYLLPGLNILKMKQSGGHFNNNKITTLAKGFVQTWCSISAPYSNGRIYFLLRAISVPVYRKDSFLTVYQAWRAVWEKEEGWGREKVVAEDVLVVKYYFSCRRIVSRTTRLMMELQSEYEFPSFFLYLLIICKVGRPLLVLESCYISLFLVYTRLLLAIYS